MTDYLIVGLGNPTSKHASDRHNVGFWAINRLAKRHGIDVKGGGRLAHTGKGRIGDAEVVLAKPQTWMNNSGQAVVPLLRREGVPIERVIVVYDELDLPAGRLRLRPKGSAGGHNGLKSIIAATGSGDFGRVRIGIGRPLHRGVPSWDPDVVIKHVVAPPDKASRALLDEAVARAAEAIEYVLAEGWHKAMDRYNRSDPGEVSEETQ